MVHKIANTLFGGHGMSAGGCHVRGDKGNARVGAQMLCSFIWKTAQKADDHTGLVYLWSSRPSEQPQPLSTRPRASPHWRDGVVAWRRDGVAAWRREGMTAWRRDGVTAWWRDGVAARRSHL
jgi:hypothetical protein